MLRGEGTVGITLRIRGAPLDILPRDGKYLLGDRRLDASVVESVHCAQIVLLL